MTERERFNATMHYRPRDRSPLSDFGYWPETLTAWHEQGLPRSITDCYDGTAGSNDFFGLESFSGGPAINCDLMPAFERLVVEDRGEQRVVRQGDGVTILENKHGASLPFHVDHLLVDRASWRKHYLPRLDPDHPGRYPSDWQAATNFWTDPDRKTVASLNGGSLFGRLRDWMGLEAISMAVYDDPAWFEEMVSTLADCAIGTISRVLSTGGKFDGCSMWEDMCFANGPLLSPAHFNRFLVPHYRRITSLLRRHGVDVVWVDCDGKIDDLIPLWLSAGVNCMLPVEIGTWQADPVELRRRFGRELLMLGGFDKRIMMRSPDAIEAEVRRLAPLVEEGGFIPFCDHRVPPDVPFENYLFYLRVARRVWGLDCNLKPLGCVAVPVVGKTTD